MRQHSFTTRLKSLTFVFSIAMTFASCTNDDLAQNGTTPTDAKGLTAFNTGDPTTRTTMDPDGTFYWGKDDYIYVKDDKGIWNKSKNAPTNQTASFKFMVPGKYTAHNSYEVYYPGKNGNRDKVTISATQEQTEPNTTTHFGESGDCGMALASRIGTNNQFSFALDHKAAYLLFLPRTSNTILHNCYLTKVEVNSDNNITSTYTLDPTTGKLTGTGTGKQIILTTKGKFGSIYQKGFPLTNTSTSAATNGAYVVIKPGTHTLKIRYWVKDFVSGTEGTITRILASATFDQNKYYNITANLDVKDYDGDHYYMWDAQEQYWKGHEWNKGGSQPTLQSSLPGSTTSNDYPKSLSDPRFFNTTYPGLNKSNPAVHSCKDLPNANEMTWYMAYGKPRWDAYELWTTMGHLYRGGMWFKKKSVLLAEGHYNKEYSIDFIDRRKTYAEYHYNNSSIYTSGLPSVTDASNYFYLPALGDYSYGVLRGLGSSGYYWTSTADPRPATNAYEFSFLYNSIDLRSMGRYQGKRVQTFE